MLFFYVGRFKSRGSLPICSITTTARLKRATVIASNNARAKATTWFQTVLQERVFTFFDCSRQNHYTFWVKWGSVVRLCNFALRKMQFPKKGRKLQPNDKELHSTGANRFKVKQLLKNLVQFSSVYLHWMSQVPILRQIWKLMQSAIPDYQLIRI